MATQRTILESNPHFVVDGVDDKIVVSKDIIRLVKDLRRFVPSLRVLA